MWWLFDLTDTPGSGRRTARSPRDVASSRACAALFGLSFLTLALPGAPDTPDPQAHRRAQRPFGEAM